MDTTTMSPERKTDYHRGLFERQLELRRKYVGKTPEGVWQFTIPQNELIEGARVGGVLGCVDEGVDCDHSVAGSYILLGLETAVAQLSPRVLSGEITTITSHDGCGAAALAGKDGEEFARQLAQRLTEMTGIHVAHRHIPATEMIRPPDVHDATVAYLSGRPFRPGRIKRAPRGFGVNAHLHPDDTYTSAELDVIGSIALGNHGLENHFTPDNPFLIVPLGAPANGFSHDRLAQLAQKVFGDNPRVAVARGIHDIDAAHVSA